MWDFAIASSVSIIDVLYTMGFISIVDFVYDLCSCICIYVLFYGMYVFWLGVWVVPGLLWECLVLYVWNSCVLIEILVVLVVVWLGVRFLLFPGLVGSLFLVV